MVKPVKLAKMTALFACCLSIFSYASEEDYQYALALLSERQEYGLAAEKFAAFAAANPRHAKSPQALFYLAGCYAGTQKDRSAADTYKRLVNVYPQAGETLLAEAYSFGGDAYFRAGQLAMAAEMYAQLLEKFPQNPLAETAHFWRGECLARLAAGAEGKEKATYYQLTKDTLRQFLQKYPESKFTADALYSAGLAAFDFKDLAGANQYLSRFLRDFPQEPRRAEVAYQLADTAYWQKNYQLAEKRFRQLASAKSAAALSARAFTGAAWSAYAQKDFAGAGTLFEQAAAAAATKQESSAAWFNAGAAFENAERPAAAINAYEKVAADLTHAKNAPARFRLANLYRARAQNSQALAHLQKAVKQLPPGEEKAAAEVLLGEILFDQNKLDAAAQTFARLPEAQPSSAYAAFALYQLSLVQAKQKQPAAAVKTIRRLLRQYGDTPLRLRAAYALGEFFVDLGQTAKARQAYTWVAANAVAWAAKFDQSAPNIISPAIAQDLAAKALLRLGEDQRAQNPPANEAAAKFFRQLIKEYPASLRVPAAWLRLGEIAEDQKDYAQAQDAYEKAAKLAAPTPAAAMPDELLKQELAAIRRHSSFRAAVVAVLKAQAIQAPAARETALKEAQKRLAEFISAYANDAAAALLVSRCAYYQAEAAYALKDQKAARKFYQAYLAKEPDGPLAAAALLGLGWVERDLGEAGQAAARTRDALQKSSTQALSIDALRLSATLHHEQKNYAAAAKDWRRLQENFPLSAAAQQATIELAKIETALRRPAAAAKMLLDFLRLQPQSASRPAALEALGWAYWALAEPKLQTAQEARQAYRQALKGLRFEDLRGAAKEAAQARQMVWKEKLKAAWEVENKMVLVLKKFLADYPEHELAPAAALRLGETFFARADYQAAADFYKRAQQNGAVSVVARARYRLGWCHLKLAKGAQEPRQKRRAAALALFTALAAQKPPTELTAECAWLAADLLREDNKQTAAQQLYKQAAQSPEAAIRDGALYGMGLSLLAVKRDAAALVEFQRLLAVSPRGKLRHEANWGAGQAALNLGANADAKQYFNAAKADNYGGEAAAKARYGLGQIAFQAQDWKTAREEFRKVDVFHRHWQDVAAQALLQAAAASQKLGQHNLACDDWRRIVERYPQSQARLKAEENLHSFKAAAKPAPVALQ